MKINQQPTVESGSAAQGVPMNTPNKSRRSIALGGIIVVVLALGIGAWLLTRDTALHAPEGELPEEEVNFSALDQSEEGLAQDLPEGFPLSLAALSPVQSVYKVSYPERAVDQYTIEFVETVQLDSVSNVLSADGFTILSSGEADKGFNLIAQKGQDELTVISTGQSMSATYLDRLYEEAQ